VDLESALIIILVASASVGWLTSFYFHRVHHQKSQEAVWWMPRMLQMMDCRCDEIVESSFGSTFGRSNAFWGLWYYPALGLTVLSSNTLGIPDTGVLFIIVLLAFAYSIYLAWGLYLLKVACRPCFGAHVINSIVFLILLYRAYPLLVNS
jgi:uncharacterized membrane protein